MDDIGEDRNARRKVRKIFLPYNVEDDGVHTDIAQWRLRKLKTDSDEVDEDDPDNFHQHHHSIKSPLPPRPKSAGEILDTTGRPVPPSETKADKFATPRIDEGARTPRIGADWPVAQFARKFREEIFRGRHLEKYEAVAMTQNVELAGRTNKLELEMDNAISGTIKCYSKLRKEYIKQRDTLPIDFLKYDVADGKGLPYIRERAAGKIYKWMNRILMKRVGRHFAQWIKLLMWFRWLRKVKRGLKVMVRVSRRISMRKWKLHTFLHREAERLRAAIVLQRLIRGHFGRKKAYRQLRINAAHAIQMRLRMFQAVTLVDYHRRRREGAKAMQRMWRYMQFKKHCVILMQTWYRMRRAKNEFLQIKESTRKIMEKWLASFLARKQRAYYLHLKRGNLVASRHWRGKVARKLYWRLHCARLIQARWRANMARWLIFHMFRRRAVLKIQPVWRGYLGRIIFIKRKAGQVCIQKYFLKWTAERNYKKMIASRNRAKKSARIRVSVRPIHGISHIIAAVKPGTVEWRWERQKRGMPPIAKAVWMAKRGLEILAFRVSDGVDYKIVMEHKELQQRWEMYRLRGKRTPGPYSKAFLNLLFDQLKVSPLHGTAQIVRTTRTERGKKIGALTHKVGKRWFIVTVWLYNEEYCWRAFDPQNQRTYRGTVLRRELEKRLNRYDAVEELNEEYRQFPLLSKKAFGWVLGRMVVYDRYAMQAFWKSPIYDEGILILDQQEDVMAMRIQCGFRCMLARGKLFEKIKEWYRKMWDKEYQSYYYFSRITETRSWDQPLLLWRTNRWDIEPIDIWDPVIRDGEQWYFNGARDAWSYLSEAEAADIIGAFYKKHIMGDSCSLPSLADLAKAVRFKELVLDAYEKHPEKLSAIVNMALLTHTSTHNYKTARQLYKKALKLSDANPTILYSVGLFELADRTFRYQEPRWQLGLKYISDAKELDRRRDKFGTAEKMFFKFAVIIGSNDPRSLRNWALVHQCIREDYKTADKLYCRSLTLDPYDENTQVNYDNFVHEFRKGGIYDRAGPPIAIKKNCTLKREETIDGQHWQLFQNPEAILKAHRTFWYCVPAARTRWVSPKWKPRGFLPTELQIMKAKKRIVTAENRYRKNTIVEKAKAREKGQNAFLNKLEKRAKGGLTSPGSSKPATSANTSPTGSQQSDDLYHGGSLAELLGAAPGSPVATELTSMQQMLITTSQRLIELEAKQNENDELERIKSMVEEQNAKISQLMESLQKQESGFEKPEKM